MPLTLTINGQVRTLESLSSGSNIKVLLEVLALKHDRVALELNGELIPRLSWDIHGLKDNDKIELVHFVGGGTDTW